ncbi:MAG: hypothetical protein AMJ42_05710 [Deltaproteobacteria bacterium DG_8]|nr:MAG: hypothetical protein AMJ42_05710 [Deltaproteobacteria bacterium DG_8]
MANTTGEGCEIGDYEWSIVDSDIGSVIDQEGNYSAGINNTGSQVTDVIKVVDHANSDIYTTATIIVEDEGGGKIVAIFPKTLLGSRWIPLPYLLLVFGENTNFEPSSTIEFEPDDDIIKLGHLGFDNIFLALILLIKCPHEGTVSIAISTEGKVVTGELSIKTLPRPFADDYSDIAEAYMEISLDTSTLVNEYSRMGIVEQGL